MSAKQTENRKKKQIKLENIMSRSLFIRCNADSRHLDKISLVELQWVEKTLDRIKCDMASR